MPIHYIPETIYSMYVVRECQSVSQPARCDQYRTQSLSNVCPGRRLSSTPVLLWQCCPGVAVELSLSLQVARCRRCRCCCETAVLGDPLLTYAPSNSTAGQTTVWFIPFVDKRLGVQVKVCNPLTTRAIRQRFWCWLSSKRRCIECPHLYGLGLCEFFFIFVNLIIHSCIDVWSKVGNLVNRYNCTRSTEPYFLTNYAAGCEISPTACTLWQLLWHHCQ